MHKQWGRVHWTTFFFGCPLTHDRSIYPLLSLPLTSRRTFAPAAKTYYDAEYFQTAIFYSALPSSSLPRGSFIACIQHTREIRQMASWFTRVPDRRHSVAPSLVSCPLPFFSFNTGNVHCAPYNNGSSWLTWNSAGAIVLVVCQNMSWLSVFVFNLISGRHVVSDNVVAPDINLNFDFVLK
jgi:hypothetical protein